MFLIPLRLFVQLFCSMGRLMAKVWGNPKMLRRKVVQALALTQIKGGELRVIVVKTCCILVIYSFFFQSLVPIISLLLLLLFLHKVLRSLVKHQLPITVSMLVILIISFFQIISSWLNFIRNLLILKTRVFSFLADLIILGFCISTMLFKPRSILLGILNFYIFQNFSFPNHYCPIQIYCWLIPWGLEFLLN